MFEDWYRMKGLLKNPGIRRDLEHIITHRFRFDKFQEAMETMRSGNSGKVVLEL
jgi:threonine 3-dehydrogenase